MGTQVTTSESHPAWKNRKSGKLQGDLGGDFLMRKQYVATPETACQRRASATYKDSLHTGFTMRASWVGGAIPSGIPTNPFSGFQDSSNAELDTWGAKAIANCKPDNQVTSATTALAELYHDGLPHLLGSALWKDRTLSAKNAGEDYLNYEFGFKPLANDIASFAFGVVEFDRLMRQYERDAGKVVRRRYNFPPIESTTYSKVLDPAGVSCIPWNTVCDVSNARGVTYLSSRTTTKRWFSGAFTYYLPKRGGFDPYVDRARHLLGIDLTPEVLWDLTPWSWAVDWFTNAGDVISNFQSFAIDGLVMHYGYIMEHKVTRNTYYYDGPLTSCFGSAAAPAVITFVTETKVRRRANPYGFGLTWSGLSARQKSILSALGLTRLR
jgi:hypothetical protein